jgi:hypothetical protein
LDSRHDQWHGGEGQNPIYRAERPESGWTDASKVEPIDGPTQGPSEPRRADDNRESRCGARGMPPRPVQDLRGRHVIQLEAGSDVRQRTAFDCRLPERLSLAGGELAEDGASEIAVHDRRLDVGPVPWIPSKRHQRMAIALTASQHIETVVASNR